MPHAEIGAGRGRLDFSVVGDVDGAPLMAALGLEVRVQLARCVGRRRAYMHPKQSCEKKKGSRIGNR